MIRGKSLAPDIALNAGVGTADVARAGGGIVRLYLSLGRIGDANIILVVDVSPDITGFAGKGTIGGSRLVHIVIRLRSVVLRLRAGSWGDADMVTWIRLAPDVTLDAVVGTADVARAGGTIVT